MPFFETEQTANWCLEACSTQGTGDLILTGADSGFVRFNDGNTIGDYVWYSITDGPNREAGIGLLQNNLIQRVNVTATLLNGVYSEGENLDPLPLSGNSIVAGTFNAASFNEMWKHIWDKNNPHETTGGTGGEPNTGQNLGAGEGEVFAQKSGFSLEFRTLKQGNNVTITQSANEIEIASNAGGGGEANTASNLSEGVELGTVGLFNRKVGVDLQFSSLAAGPGIALNKGLETVTIENLFTDQTTASNLGTGAGVFANEVGSDLRFRSLIGGTNITIQENANDITINGTAPFGGEDGELLWEYTNDTGSLVDLDIEDTDIPGTLANWAELELAFYGGAGDATGSWGVNRTLMQLAGNGVYADSYQYRVWTHGTTPYQSVSTGPGIEVATADDNSWQNFARARIFNRGNLNLGPFVESEMTGANVDGPDDVQYEKRLSFLTAAWTSPLTGIRLLGIKRFANVRLYGMRRL